jgi:hypothetical protein
MNKYIIWLRYSLVLTILIVSVVSVFNYKIDGLGLFGNSNHLLKAAKALTNGKMIAGLKNNDERLFQELIIKNLQVKNDVIAIGSSKTILLRKRFFLEDKINFFNHSVSGASLEDYIAIVGLYESIHGYLPHEIILGIDPWVFNKYSDQTRWKSLSKYYNYEINKIYNITHTSATTVVNTSKWKQLINYEYTVLNINTFKNLLQNDWQFFYITETIDIDDSIKESDGSIHYPNKLRHPNYDKVKKSAIKHARGQVYSLSNYKRLDNTQLFNDFIKYLQLNGTEVIFYLPAYHPNSYDLLIKNIKYKYLNIAEDYLVNFAKENNIKIKGSYNPHTGNFTYKNFFDAMHGEESIVENIFKSSK